MIQNSAAASFLDLMLKISLQTAIFAVVVWVITRLKPKSPAAWRNALWLLVLVKFVIPPFVYYPTELAFWNAPAQQSQSISVHHSQDEKVGIETPNTEGNVQLSSNSNLGNNENYVPYIQVQPKNVLQDTNPYTFNQIIVTVWAIAAGVMLLLLMIRYIAQVRLVRNSTPVSRQMNDLLSEVAQHIRPKRMPVLRLSENAKTPMLVGCLKPVILLPSRITEQCSESDVKAMLLHELAHVKRHDLLTVWLQQFVQIFFFFHPMLWLAGYEIKRERELACDELVLTQSAISAKDYAAGYISALKLANLHHTSAISLAMAEPLELEKKRLYTILNAPKRVLSIGWGIALAVVLVIGLPTFAALSHEITAADIAEALVNQEKACGQSLTVESTKTYGENMQYTESSTYIRTPDVLVVKRKDDAWLSTVSYDRIKKEYRKFSWYVYQKVGKPSSSNVLSDIYATISDRRSLPFDTQDFTETTLYCLFEGTLSEMIARGAINPEQKDIDGHLCVRVDIPSQREPIKGYKVWVDKEIGYNPRRIEVDWKSYKPQIISFKNYTQACPGFWFPMEFSVVLPRGDKVVRVETKVTKISTDQKYVKNDLLVKFAPGTLVHNEMTRSSFIWRGSKEYPVDERRLPKSVKPRTPTKLPAVKGSGVVVTLMNSPKLSPSETRKEIVDNYSIHDVDLKGVANALFAAEAKAVSVNDQRVIYNTHIFRYDDIMKVRSVSKAPTYTIKAVGDPKALYKGLIKDNGVVESLSSLGMIKISEVKQIKIPAKLK